MMQATRSTQSLLSRHHALSALRNTPRLSSSSFTMFQTRKLLSSNSFYSGRTCMRLVGLSFRPHGSRAMSTTSASESNSRFRFWNWRRFAWVVRTLRIPVLVLSVYSLGYQQGIIECTKHPDALQEQILRGLLAGQGVKNMEEQVVVLNEHEISYLSRHPHHQVAVVGDRIVSVAREYVQQELEKVMMEFQANLPNDIAPEKALELMKKDQEVEFWYNATLRLIGETNSSNLIGNLMVSHEKANENKTALAAYPPGTAAAETNVNNKEKKKRPIKLSALKTVPWQYIFVSSENPNAFVSEILPRRFFITTSMLHLATTPDELAMVLGHEISHLILGHVSAANQMETMLRTIEVLLLSLDPTSGVLSLLFIGALATLRTALSAAHSRDNEREADDLGIVLAARACYDTEAGSYIMKKMHDQKEAMAPKRSTVSTTNKQEQDRSETASLPTLPQPEQLQLLDTHPPSMERFERLRQQARDGENYRKYQDGACATVTSRIAAALGWG